MSRYSERYIVTTYRQASAEANLIHHGANILDLPQPGPTWVLGLKYRPLVSKVDFYVS